MRGGMRGDKRARPLGGDGMKVRVLWVKIITVLTGKSSQLLQKKATLISSSSVQSNIGSDCKCDSTGSFMCSSEMWIICQGGIK